jgi:hypothetical protein
VRLLAVAAVVVVVAFGAPRATRADSGKPWAAGVSADDQKKALALYDKGNAFFADDHYKEALAEYEQALAAWKHPAIYYNAAVCLLNLDRAVDAYEDFTEAMKFGADPIGADHFAQAKNYLKALGGQVASLEVRSTYAGGDVRLDGGPLLQGAGSVTRRVRAGSHQIVATAENYKPQTETIVADPNKQNVIVIELKPLPVQRKLVHRWAAWKPWATAAGGAALAGLGGASTWLAFHNRSAYETWVQQACTPANDYCAGRPVDSSGYDHAKIEYPAGISALVVGGGLLATGVVMIYLNQGRMMAVAPSYDGEHAGLTISGRW